MDDAGLAAPKGYLMTPYSFLLAILASPLEVLDSLDISESILYLVLMIVAVRGVRFENPNRYSFFEVGYSLLITRYMQPLCQLKHIFFGELRLVDQTKQEHKSIGSDEIFER